MTATITYETVTAALRYLVDNSTNAGVHAAAELLLWHDGLIRRGDFQRLAAMVDGDGDVRIAWRQLREAFDHGAAKFSPMSSSEYAILELAISLATDRFRFNILGHAHAAAVLRAFTTALPQAAEERR